jgi:prepilin-type N-terminal cleavage/methylation domain-containing protein
MKRGFTLIELLVVITIIVVLLALLAPALDRAIYQAELAVCAAQQKTVTTGAAAYAVQYARAYPHRPTRQGFNLTVDIVRGGVDDRPTIRLYIPIRALLDPFTAAVDLETRDSYWVQSAFYSLWFGVGYPGQAGMKRLGDRFSWDARDATGKTQRASFDFLVTDSDYITNQNGRQLYSSHPDDAGRLKTEFAQDVPDVFGLLAPTFTGGQFGSGITFSYWTGADRGPVDLNYGRADGSVARFNRVLVPYDDRMHAVPVTHDASNYDDWRQQIPTR